MTVVKSLPIVEARTQFGFTRTECCCGRCVVNCLFMPGYLIPNDLVRLKAKHGAAWAAWADEHLLASPGALVMAQGRAFRIRTLVPARQPAGRCIFLTEQARCSVHEDAPFGCAFFDEHIPDEQSSALSQRGLRQVHMDWQTGGEYSRLWARLAHARKVAPPPEQCRAEMEDFLTSLERGMI